MDMITLIILGGILRIVLFVAAAYGAHKAAKNNDVCEVIRCCTFILVASLSSVS